MLFATIEASLKKGWIAGPEVRSGAYDWLSWFSVCSFSLELTSFFGDGTISVIFLIGGLALVVFGLLTVKDARNAASSSNVSQDSSGLKLKSSPAINRHGHVCFESLFLDLVVNCGQCSSTQGI